MLKLDDLGNREATQVFLELEGTARDPMDRGANTPVDVGQELTRQVEAGMNPGGASWGVVLEGGFAADSHTVGGGPDTKRDKSRGRSRETPFTEVSSERAKHSFALDTETTVECSHVTEQCPVRHAGGSDGVGIEAQGVYLAVRDRGAGEWGSGHRGRRCRAGRVKVVWGHAGRTDRGVNRAPGWGDPERGGPSIPQAHQVQ